VTGRLGERATKKEGIRGNRGKIGMVKFGSNKHQNAYMLLKYFPVQFIILIFRVNYFVDKYEKKSRNTQGNKNTSRS